MSMSDTGALFQPSATQPQVVSRPKKHLESRALPPKMNPEVKRKWLERLRDPRYEYCSFSLRMQDGRQKIAGVLCSLHAEEFGGEWVENGNCFSYLGRNSIMPDIVAIWSGLSNTLNPSYMNLNWMERSLARDEQTIESITKMIEELL